MREDMTTAIEGQDTASQGVCLRSIQRSATFGVGLGTARSLRRAGFTLVELLVVLVLVLLLAALAVAFVPKATERAKSSRGADQLQQWLLIAKQWAKKDRVPTGIRFQPNTTKPRYVTDLQYIQQPDNFCAQGDVNGLKPNVRRAKVANNPVSGLNDQVVLEELPANLRPPGLPPGSPPPANTQIPMDFSSGNGLTPINNTFVKNNYDLWAVQIGDYFEIKGGLPHRIKDIGTYSYSAGSPGDPIPGTVPPVFEANVLTLESLPAQSPFPATVPFTKDYRIIRAPRVLQGEAALQFPQDVAVDLNLSLPQGSAPFDILFSASGALLSPASVSDKLILWVRDTAQDGLQGDQTLMVVYARTGFIATHQISSTPTTTATSNAVPAGQGVNVSITIASSAGILPQGYVVLDTGGAQPELQPYQLSGNQINVGQVNYQHAAPFTLIFDPFSFTRDGRSSGL